MHYMLSILFRSVLSSSAIAADSGAVPGGPSASFRDLASSPGAIEKLGKRAASLGVDVGQVRTLLAAARGMDALEPEPEHRGQLEAELFRTLAPAVVLVITTDNEGTWTGIGSGSVLSADGQVLTNLHVVEGHEWVLLFLRPPPGVEFGTAYGGVVEKTDAVTDLALLKMLDPPAGLRLMPLGDMAAVEVGQDVHAIGHPVGETWTYTKGLVSQVRHDYEWTIGAEAHRATIIQTQTPINPGNSGGPLFNDSGRLVGVNTFANVEAQGINYAVGVDEIKAFLARQSSRAGAKKPPEPVWSTNDGVRTKDTNGDGKADVWVSDDDGNGRPEFVGWDADFDGITEHWLMDSNENGEAEAEGFDRDGDGKPDCYKLDTDEDGDWDEFAIDQDLDGRPESVTRL